MKHIRLYESKDNSSLKDVPDGFYTGYLQGYVVDIDNLGISFNTTTGVRNAIPIKCHIYVENGEAIAFHKSGILFSDEKVKNEWKLTYPYPEKYDPRSLKARKELE